jgi:hypothetical protein
MPNRKSNAKLTIESNARARARNGRKCHSYGVECDADSTTKTTTATAIHTHLLSANQEIVAALGAFNRPCVAHQTCGGARRTTIKMEGVQLVLDYLMAIDYWAKCIGVLNRDTYVPSLKLHAYATRDSPRHMRPSQTGARPEHKRQLKQQEQLHICAILRR